MLKVGLPSHHEKTEPAPLKVPLEDKIRDLVEEVDSGRESYQQWLILNKFYKGLKAKPNSPRVKNLKKMIEPILSKYGQHKVTVGE